MKKLLGKTHRYLYLGSVLLCFSLVYPLLAYWSRSPQRHFTRIARTRKLIGWWSSALVGFFYRFEPEEPIDWSKTYIICPNHTSYLDITAMVLMCPPNFSFMGKIELLNNPVTGLFFRTIDIPVDRNSKVSSFKAFKRAQERLVEGRSVVIFPEGFIGEEYPPRLYEFKNGPFKLAIEMGVPVIPVVIHDAWKLYWDEAKQFGSRPGRTRISVLKPIPTDALEISDANALRDHVHAVMQKHWNSTNNL